jgi:hypothetical protein
MKECPQCGEIKGDDGFYKRDGKPSGSCKVCNRKYDRARYYRSREKRLLRDKERIKKNPNLYKERNKVSKERYPEKHKARQIMSNAIRAGKLVRMPCEVCVEPKSHGHHHDYSKPLDVHWLCVKHHMEQHRKYKETELKLLTRECKLCGKAIISPKKGQLHCGSRNRTGTCGYIVNMPKDRERLRLRTILRRKAKNLQD